MREYLKNSYLCPQSDQFQNDGMCRDIAKIVVVVLALCGGCLSASGQQQAKMTRKEYIERYAPLAVEQQTLYGIPASITLAQGLLESGNGNSRLATEANNHFGIKCGSSWEGRSVRHDDDALQECFRAYDSVEESYIDHSLILSERKWYRPLFDLDPKDYKGWAHGLKKAGYATNPRYAELLIKIIEEYELFRYDNALLADYVTPTTPAPEVEKAPEGVESPVAAPSHRVNIDNHRVAIHKVGGYGVYAEGGRRYVVASEGDNLSRVSDAVGVSVRALRRINDMPKEKSVIAGERIYLER